MATNIVTSITYFGKAIDDSRIWLRWYEFSVDLFKKIEYIANYVSIKSQSMSSGKVMKIERVEKKIKKVIENGESIRRLSLFSLPPNFSSASFDYNVMAVRSSDFLTLILDSDIYDNKISFEIIDSLKKYIKPEKGEIYTMDRYDSPLAYAFRVNPIDSFKSLNIIKKL